MTRTKLLDAGACASTLRLVFGETLPVAALRDDDGNADPSGAKVTFDDFKALYQRHKLHSEWARDRYKAALRQN